MKHGGDGEFCSFSIEGQRVCTSMESVMAKFVDAPAAAAPFKRLYDERERSFDVFLTKDKPPDVERPVYACLLRSKHERDRQLQADAVQFLLDLGETYQSPLTHTLSAVKGPSTGSSHVVHTLPSEDIRKLCRLAGVACESGDVYDEIREVALEFLGNLLRDQVSGVTHQADGPLVISCDTHFDSQGASTGPSGLFHEWSIPQHRARSRRRFTRTLAGTRPSPCTPRFASQAGMTRVRVPAVTGTSGSKHAEGGSRRCTCCRFSGREPAGSLGSLK
eukprot:488402-Prymnesium_polylepis.2